nr:hypothetical protein [Clostridium neonatale]DAW05984.1 MAG TPA: hypothetical protein [Caudoviricetes sp.]
MELFFMQLGVFTFIYISCFIVDSIISNTRKQIKLYKVNKDLKLLDNNIKKIMNLNK